MAIMATYIFYLTNLIDTLLFFKVHGLMKHEQQV